MSQKNPDVNEADTIIPTDSEAVSGLVVDSTMIAAAAKDAREEDLLLKKHELKWEYKDHNNSYVDIRRMALSLLIQNYCLTPLAMVLGHVALFLFQDHQGHLLGAALIDTIID